MRDWHLLAETTHFTHIKGVVTCVTHRTSTEEQARLEERVGKEVEHTSGPGANTEGHDHVAELRDR